MIDAVIIAVATAWTETLKFNATIWMSLTESQRKQIVDWYIEDVKNHRDFWKKLADSIKEGEK